MSIRRVLMTVAATGAATICAATFALTVGAGSASADLVSGPTTLTTNGSTAGTVTPGTPYSSGQSITVSVAANTTMNSAALTAAGISPTGNFYLLECTAVGGNLPSGPSNCESSYVQTSAHASDGSMQMSGANSFTVEDLPNSALGAPTMTGKCDVAPNVCVVGIFSQNPGVAGGAAFTTPHIFSAAFQVQPDPTGTDSGTNPGDGTPEVPLAIGLPLAGIAVFGGWSLRNRRRRQQQAA